MKTSRILALILVSIITITPGFSGVSAEPGDPIVGAASEDSPPVPKALMVSKESLDALENLRLAKESEALALRVVMDKEVVTRGFYASLMVAKNIVTQTQGRVDDYARETYIFGSPTTSQLILNSKSVDISDTIHALNYISAISSDKSYQVNESLLAAKKNQERYEEELGELSRLQLLASVSEKNLIQARNRLSTAVASASQEERTALVATSSIDSTGCPTEVPSEAVIGFSEKVDINSVCLEAIRQAKSPEAKAAVSYAFNHLGSPYACEGVGRMNKFQFDCSSYVSRAYEEGANIVTSRNGWAPTTHTMIPTSNPNFIPVAPNRLSSGDLVLYYTCPKGEVCTYNHVVMYIGEINGVPMQLHTNRCGGVANLTTFWGTKDSEKGKFLGVRKVASSESPWEPPMLTETGGLGSVYG